jgi:hypothetical protein
MLRIDTVSVHHQIGTMATVTTWHSYFTDKATSGVEKLTDLYKCDVNGAREMIV